MKKIIANAGLFILTAVAQANHSNSELNLRMNDNSAFTAFVDRIEFSCPTSELKIQNLAPGNHFLTVVKFYRDFYHPHRSFKKVVFKGNIFIPAASEIFSTIDRFGNYSITREFPLGGRCDNDLYENSFGHSSDCNNPVPCTYEMSPFEFRQLENSIVNRSFDSSKLEIAKQGISMNHVSSRQVATLLNLFSFESYKLDLAKFAYGFTTDKQNFFLVNDSFTFESSVRDLNDYLYRN